VESSFTAGYFDRRKIIIPGVAGTDTITELHAVTFPENPKAPIRVDR
jgi:nickel-dependent lactate racemase